MGITKTKLALLSPAERAEIEEILREFAGQKGQFTARYCSDEGDTLAWFLLLGLCGLGGVIAGVIERVPTAILQRLEYGIDGLFALARSPITLGFATAALALAWSLWTFFRVHGRVGWMVTSFGVLRVFGPKIRLLRFAHIASARRTQVGTRRRFSVLELNATDGRRMTTFATPLMEAILAQISRGAAEERSRSERERDGTPPAGV
jgi:hypothetical protein